MNQDILNDYLNNLNQEQRQAATLGNESAVILAAAGSGKTSTLTARIAYLIIEKQIPAHNILAVTFTNKAAKEMGKRLQKMGLDTKNLWIGTFHGICNKILRYHSKEAGLQKNFNIMDMQEQESFFKRMLRANGYEPKSLNTSELLSQINGYKEVGWRSNQLRSGTQERKIYELYEKACIKDNCVDFGELLLGCYELFVNHEQIAESYTEKFQHILVDEFQDTNELQYKWLKILAEKHRNIFAVGDDDQCLEKGTLIKTVNGDIPIEDLNVGDLVISKANENIYQKRIINKFEKKYKGEAIELIFTNGKKVISTPEHNWFAQLSKKHSPQKYFVYLMYKKEFGFRIGTSCVHSKGQKITGVYQRAQHEHAEKQWIISWHDSETDSRYQEMVFSLNYGIPTIPFVARNGKKVKMSTIVTNQELLAKFFKEIKTMERGIKLIKDLGLSFENAHHIPRSRNNKQNITITLCGNVRGNVVLHTLEYYTSSEDEVKKLSENGLNPSYHKKEGHFRFRFHNKNFTEIENVKNKINNLLDNPNFIYNAKFDNITLSQLYAKELVPGMIMIGDNEEKLILKDVKKINIDTTIYDIDVEHLHNFYANGVLSHNSIYSFRGAKPENMNLVLRDFNAKLIKIEKNYRSDANILEAANAIISNNKNRQGKNLVATHKAENKILTFFALNDEEESAFIAQEIKKQRRSGENYKNMAILYRTNGQSRSLEKAMNAQSIPYMIYGGFRFFDRQEVKHAMAYLRLAHNPNDNMAFLRVANIPVRSIGDTTLKKLDMFATENDLSLFEASKQWDDKNKKKMAPFIELLEFLHKNCKGKTLPQMTRFVIIDSGLEKMYENDKKEGPERLDNLYELISAAEVFYSENKTANIEEFLAFSSLESDVPTEKRDENMDAVKLMTVHASKGLEFNYVFISGMEEALFPHANSIGEASAIEEERRLMYVAITRAKKQLYISHCEERLMHGQRNRMVKSRFLKELPPDVLEKIR